MAHAGRLAGRTCLIVGGTSGIGLATARRFLEEGARVVVAGRSALKGEATRALFPPGAPVWDVVADVTRPAEVSGLFHESLRRLDGRLDILFHVAGISGRRLGDGPLHECSDEGWDAILEVNARGMFLTNREAVRQMRKQPLDATGLRGTVLNMGSVLGWSPSPRHFGTYAYAASKGAARSMTLIAAATYAPERIRFNLIAPSVIETPMAARAIGDPVIRAYLTEKQPMASGPGSPDDCAEAALYLCEPASRFVTGAVLEVDGGWTVSEGSGDGEDRS